MTWSSKAFYSEHQTPGMVREAAVVKEVLKGNVPSWMFKMIDVSAAAIKAEVMPDYLCIGTDDDFVRVPLTPFAAQYLAKHYGYNLPTPVLVDWIWSNALTQLKPIEENWNYVAPETGTMGFRFIEHSHAIDAQMDAGQRGSLVAGHKKDIVSTPKLVKVGHKVAIYGWHTQKGSAIQPLFLGHDWTYCDYSHGIRFVKSDDPFLAGPCSLDVPPREFLEALK